MKRNNNGPDARHPYPFPSKYEPREKKHDPLCCAFLAFISRRSSHSRLPVWNYVWEYISSSGHKQKKRPSYSCDRFWVVFKCLSVSIQITFPFTLIRTIDTYTLICAMCIIQRTDNNTEWCWRSVTRHVEKLEWQKVAKTFHQHGNLEAAQTRFLREFFSSSFQRTFWMKKKNWRKERKLNIGALWTKPASLYLFDSLI